MKNKIFIISGTSGSGKTTIAKKIVNVTDSITHIKTCTTRLPRDEAEKKEYFFLTKTEFEKNISDNKFLEYSKVYNDYYGIDREYFFQIYNKKKNILLILDVQGTEKMKEQFSVFSIFISSPSYKENIKRINCRGKHTQIDLNMRKKFIKKEVEQKKKFDYVTVNRDVDKSVQKILLKMKEIITYE